MLSPEYWSAISTLPTIINDGPKQRCWAHLLRDIHDQRTRYPKDAALAPMGREYHQLYVAAKACNHHEPWQRRVAQLAWERKLMAICRPFLSDPSESRASCAGASSATSRNSSSSWPNRTCQRTTTRPSAPCAIWLSAARSAAAPGRSRAPSARTLASLFGTWRAQGLNPLAACRQLLVSPLL